LRKPRKKTKNTKFIYILQFQHSTFSYVRFHSTATYG